LIAPGTTAGASADAAFRAETRQLVDRPLSDALLQDAGRGQVRFNGLLADEVRAADTPAERSGALRVLRQYRTFVDVDATVRARASTPAGRPDAIAIALGTNQGQLTFAFEDVDWYLGVLIRDLQDQFDSDLQLAVTVQAGRLARHGGSGGHPVGPPACVPAAERRQGRPGPGRRGPCVLPRADERRAGAGRPARDRLAGPGRRRQGRGRAAVRPPRRAARGHRPARGAVHPPARGVRRAGGRRERPLRGGRAARGAGVRRRLSAPGGAGRRQRPEPLPGPAGGRGRAPLRAGRAALARAAARRRRLAP